MIRPADQILRQTADHQSLTHQEMDRQEVILILELKVVTESQNQMPKIQELDQEAVSQFLGLEVTAGLENQVQVTEQKVAQVGLAVQTTKRTVRLK